MGEKIKVLSSGALKNLDIEFELNKPDKIGGLQTVHIQNDQFRLDMDEIEFFKVATGILAAKRKLKVLKGEL